MSWVFLASIGVLIAAIVLIEVRAVRAGDERQHHAPGYAFVMGGLILIGIGIPILGYVTWQNGPWVGLLVMVAAMSVLRWPVIYVGRWIKRRIGQTQ